MQRNYYTNIQTANLPSWKYLLYYTSVWQIITIAYTLININ